MSPSSMQGPRIAIIGGGPGGLVLARILQINGLHATIYEREASPNERQQGGSLDLHPESGILAMKAAGLFDQFKKYARYEGEQMKVIDKHGVVHLDELTPLAPPPPEGEDDDHSNGRPEIDRTDLRQILLDSLQPNTIKWGYSLRAGTPCSAEDDGAYKLEFTNGHTEIADFVVGADGGWSRVRPLLSKATPLYTGVSFTDLTIHDIERTPELSKLVGQGLVFIVSDGRGLLVQRNSGGRVRVYGALRVPEPWVDDESNIPSLNGSNATAVLDAIINLFPGWDSSVLGFIRQSDPNSYIPRKIYALPTHHTWESKPYVTLIGDAAHLMSPFAGEGVNLAMIDAHDIAFALLDAYKHNNKSISEAVEGYEKVMFQRGEEKAEESARNLDIIFSDDAPKSLVDLIASYPKGPPDHE